MYMQMDTHMDMESITLTASPPEADTETVQGEGAVAEEVGDLTRELMQWGLSSSSIYENGHLSTMTLGEKAITRYTNPTKWPLYLIESGASSSTCSCDCPYSSNIHKPHGGVYSRTFIPANTYLGEMEGERMYVWELTEDMYDSVIWVMEDCVIYFRDYPRSILTYVREGLYDSTAGSVNCCLDIQTNEEGMTEVWMKTLTDIYENQELVYMHPENP